MIIINSSLTANSKHFYFDYKDGKYGYNTSPSRGADTFVPFMQLTEIEKRFTYTIPSGWGSFNFQMEIPSGKEVYSVTAKESGCQFMGISYSQSDTTLNISMQAYKGENGYIVFQVILI